VGVGTLGASVDESAPPPDPLPQPSPARGVGVRRVSIDAGDFPAAPLSSTRLGKNPAKVLPPPVGAISSTERPARALANSAS